MPKSFYERSEETVFQAISACKSAATLSFVVHGSIPDFDKRLHDMLRSLDADDGVQIKPALGVAGKSSRNFSVSFPFTSAYALYSAILNKQHPEIYEKLGEEEWNLLGGIHAIIENPSSSIRVAIPVGSMTNPSVSEIKNALTQIANGHRQAPISINESNVLFCSLETAKKYGFEINPHKKELPTQETVAPIAAQNAVTTIPPSYITFELQKTESDKKDFGHFRYQVTSSARQWDNFSQYMNRAKSGIMPVSGLYSFYVEQGEVSTLLDSMSLINHPVPEPDEEVYYDTLARRCPWNPEIFGKAYHFNDKSWHNNKHLIEEFACEHPDGIICVVSTPDRGNNLFSGKNFSLLIDDRFISQFSSKLNAKTTILEQRPDEDPDTVVKGSEATVAEQNSKVKRVDFRNRGNK